jgi:anti-anti-sigma factor
MKINIRESGDVRIVNLAGSLDANTSITAETMIYQLLDSGTSKLVINLAETDYISSAGLRVLLSTAKRISAGKGRFILCQPNPAVYRILEISGFLAILDFRKTEAEALAEI